MTDLTHLVLEDSYVLGISVEPYRLEFRMDFALAPEHPKYEVPKASEQECYRRGAIRVVDFCKLTWSASNLRPSTDATGEPDFGCLDQMLTKDGQVGFSGDWGNIEVDQGKLTVSFDE